MCKKALAVQLFLQRIDEQLNTIETEAFALMVEVKVGVVYAWVGSSNDRGLEGLFNSFLVAFLVDEIDGVDVAVLFDLSFEVAFAGFDGVGKIHNLQVRLVAQIVDLGPVDGNRASDLDIAVADVTLSWAASGWRIVGAGL